MQPKHQIIDIAEHAPISAVRLVGALRQIAPDIEARAAAGDAAGRFPRHEIDLLRDIGLLAAFAAVEHGGARFPDRGAYVDCLFDCLRLIGRSNLSLGRIFEGHVNAIALIEAYGGRAMKQWLTSALAEGRLLGIWNTEPEPGVWLARETDGWRLVGSKSYATGTGCLDHAIVTARRPDGSKQMLVLAVGQQPDRADASAWQTSGMRGTVSGTYDFSRMPVPDDAMLGNPGDYEREPMFTAGAWRFTAVQLGAIEAIVACLRAHLRRAGHDAGAVQRARFGHAVAAARTAWMWVREAARRAELEPTMDAVPFVLLTRGVVEEAGLGVIEAAQRIVGTRAFFAGHPLDHMMRDLALYLRQPAPDKALDRAAASWIEADRWADDPWW